MTEDSNKEYSKLDQEIRNRMFHEELKRLLERSFQKQKWEDKFKGILECMNSEQK